MNNMNYKENNNNKEFLERYAVNLNQRAREGKLDPVIGRDEEIRRVLQILSRRTKRRTILSWSENPVSVRRLSRRE